MSKLITIGKSDAKKDVKLEIGRLIVSRALITADSGGGKSWLLRKMLEQVSRTTQTIVIDPEGEFATLREKRDMVLAGPDGEVPAEPRSAALLCRRLMEMNLSAVIDLSELDIRRRREFVSIFCMTMVDLPRKLWGHCFVAIDEIHEFAPEDETAESETAVAMLSSKGRKRGFCLIGATQRLSKLSKNVAAGLKNQFLGTFSLDADIKRAAGGLGFGKDRWTEIRDLSSEKGKEGEFFAFGPAFNHRGVLKMRTGAVETTHPEPGAGRAPKPPAPSAKIKGVLAELQDLPQQAEAEIKDLAAAKGKIVELERELRRAAHARPATTVEPKADPAAMRELRQQVRTGAATIAALKKGLEQAMKMIEELEQAPVIDAEQVKRVVEAATEQIVRAAESRFKTVRRQAGPLVERLRKLIDGIPEGAISLSLPAQAPIVAERAEPAPRAPRPVKAEQAEGDDDTSVNKMTRAFLAALKQHPKGLSRVQLHILAKYAASGKTGQELARLARLGWVTTSEGKLFITREGSAAVGEVKALPVGEERRKELIGDEENRSMQGKFLKVLFDIYPARISRRELHEQAGYAASGKTGSMIAKLVRLNWVKSSDKGLRASDDFYEEFERARDDE